MSIIQGIPGGSDCKESVCSAEDLGLIHESERSPGEGNDTPVFLPGESCGQQSLEGHGLWGHKESNMTEGLSTDTSTIQGLPRWLSGKESGCQCRRHRRCEFDPWVGTIPWRRKWQCTPVFLPRESHGWRSLVGYRPRGHKEPDTTERLHLHRESISPAF